jgi:uncharacterized tellurite resistance protein B-like protein
MRDTDAVSILKWLGLAENEQAPGLDGLGEIERALTEMEPGDARYLACFAYILHRIARADHVVSEDESQLIERLVAELGGLPPARAAIVARIARVEGLKHGGTEDFLVSREFARIATREQKLALLECLFAVSASDRAIRTVEDNEIRRVASELKLDHADFIAARASHAAHLQSRRPRAEPD